MYVMNLLSISQSKTRRTIIILLLLEETRTVLLMKNRLLKPGEGVYQWTCAGVAEGGRTTCEGNTFCQKIFYE